MKRSESKYKETIGKLRKQKVKCQKSKKLIIEFQIQSVPNIYQEVETDQYQGDVSLLSLRAKSAGARVSGYYGAKKSKQLPNKGVFVGGGFSLCTSVAM